MCETHSDLKGKAQDAFWISLIDKYIDRIDELMREKEILENSVNGMETGMPALLTFQVNKLLNKVPNANINKLLMLPCCCPKEAKRYIQVPTLQNISIFDMNDSDIHKFNIIKHLIEDERSLVKKINTLLDKEINMMYKKRELDKMSQSKDSKPKLPVNLTILEDFNEQLKVQNEKLKVELVDVESDLEHYKETEGPLRDLLQKTKNDVKKMLESASNGYKDHEDKNKKSILNLKQKLQDNSRKMKQELLRNKKLKLDLKKQRETVKRLEGDVIRKILYDHEYKQVEPIEEVCECVIRKLDYDNTPEQSPSMLVKKCINEFLCSINKM